MKKEKLWSLIFPVLAVLTVYTVISSSKDFSLSQLVFTLRHSSLGWMTAALACMLGFILFEGMALLSIIRAFGFSYSLGRGFLYSAADVYFSAITPSATGGQPASAFFMMRDRIPGAIVAISLVINLIMYTLALLTVGAAAALFRPAIFLRFHLPGKLFILVGYITLCGLAASFYMLIAKPRILERICDFLLTLGKKLHLLRREKEQKGRKKIARTMEEYRHYASLMLQHKPMLLKAYFFNLLQRLSQISVTLIIYLAVGGGTVAAADIWFTQSFVTIGTYSVPIPGGVGVADYLLIDGFRALFDEAQAINLELISRGISFYVCMLASALTVMIGWFTAAKKQ